MSTKKKQNKNTKYIDLLDEDKSMAGQKFVCLSFLSPEEHIKNKDLSEDDEKKFEKIIQEYTDSFINQIDEKVSSKENELMKI